MRLALNLISYEVSTAKSSMFVFMRTRENALERKRECWFEEQELVEAL